MDTTNEQVNIVGVCPHWKHNQWSGNIVGVCPHWKHNQWSGNIVGVCSHLGHNQWTGNIAQGLFTMVVLVLTYVSKWVFLDFFPKKWGHFGLLYYQGKIISNKHLEFFFWTRFLPFTCVFSCSFLLPYSEVFPLQLTEWITAKPGDFLGKYPELFFTLKKCVNKAFYFCDIFISVPLNIMGHLISRQLTSKVR